MKMFIFSAMLLGIVAISNANVGTNYSTNDGVHSPGTLSSKSTAPSKSSTTTVTTDVRGADMESTDATHATVPTTEVNPANINTSPNPTPGRGIDNSSYGETITTDKPLINERQAEEERIQDRKTQPKR